MKRANWSLTLLLLAVVLGGPAVAATDPAPSRQAQARGAVGPNVALYRVEKVNLVVYRAAVAPDHNDAFWGLLQRRIRSRLAAAGITVLAAPEPNAPSGPGPAGAAPCISVRVNAALCDEPARYVFAVRTALSRPVRLGLQRADAPSRQRRFETVAEVWRRASPILLVRRQQAPAHLAGTVSSQIDAFLAEWAAANPPGRDVFEADRPAPAERAETPAAPAEYKYVASRNSKVFHLPGCSSARRIAPENLTGYDTRDEAIKAGKRPCKLCKP